jgi:hypothetical protein
MNSDPCCGVPVQCLRPDDKCKHRDAHHADRGLYHPLAGAIEARLTGATQIDPNGPGDFKPATPEQVQAWLNTPVREMIAQANAAKLVEVDPLGRDPHSPGAKLDAGKRRDGLVLLAFARALAEVSKVGTYGAQKYTENGWISVPDGEARYTDAMLRHMLAEGAGEARDKDTGLLHAAHAAWNALARLDLMVRNAARS